LLWAIKSLCKILYQIPLARELGNGAYLLKSERVHNTFVK